MAPIMGRGRYGVAETVGTYARPHPMPIGKSAYRKSQAVSEPSGIHPQRSYALSDKDLSAGQFAINPKPAGRRHRIEPKCRTRVYQSR
jgi:hypothetical protein